MKLKRLSLALVLLTALSYTAFSAGDSRSRLFKEAVSLYNSGMYENARSLFASLPSQDALSEGYAVLCDLKMKSPGYRDKVEEYSAVYPESSLFAQIHYLNGLNIFDDRNYALARREFDSFESKHLDKSQVAEYEFKRAYCDFKLGHDALARERLVEVEKMPFSDYTAPSRYTIGYIDYSASDFENAIKWFELAGKDPRFTQYADYYILESRFMLKDYEYVTSEGEKLFDSVPEERRSHLARIISESSLVLGDKEKAQEYYSKYVEDNEPQTRKDYFYAGTLLHAVGEWQGAVENFSKMAPRTDSLGQAASYQMADAFLNLKNQVAAMEAFKEASQLPFDAQIQEDALFNYAKLAFDLNKDPQGFSEYLDKYAATQKGDSIYSYMALVALVNHDYAAAVAAYDNIDELTPDMRGNYMKANYLRANQLVRNGSYRDAIPCLRAAAFYTGRNDQFGQLARYWLGQSYFNSESYDEAETVFTDLYNISALDGLDEGKSLIYDLAYCYFKQEDYASAAKWFDRYNQTGQKLFREDALTRRADCDFIRKDYKSAIKGYESVLAEYNNPDEVYPYYQLGLAYGLVKDNAGKIRALSRVKGADPSSLLYSEALYELGRTYVATGDGRNAISCFEHLKNTAKDNTYTARALIELGMAYRNNSEYDKALDYYKEVVETLPTSGFRDDALLAVESIYQAQGEPEKYFAYVESVGIKNGKSEEEKELVYFNSAEQIYLTENYQKALVALQKYLDAYPDGSKLAETYFYMAECYKGLGQKEKACDYYAQVLDHVDDGSYAELAVSNFAQLSYSLEHYSDAYRGWSSLKDIAKIENNVLTAELGMMRAAFRAHEYTSAISASDAVKADNRFTAADFREADYVKAKSYLSLSRRDEAFAILRQLAGSPATSEGAEASYLLIQDSYDQGDFDRIEDMVYDFSEEAGGQSYWLAKAFIVLGDAFAENDNLTQAKATFESILSGYVPYGEGDDVIDNVNMRLEKLSKMM